MLDADFGTGHRFTEALDEWRTTPPAQRPRTLHYVGIVPRCDERGVGFHRIVQDDSGVFLTLCVGELATVLRELRLEADTIRLAPADASTPWVIPLLARCCKRGTKLVMGDESFAFDPPWNIKKRNPPPCTPSFALRGGWCGLMRSGGSARIGIAGMGCYGFRPRGIACPCCVGLAGGVGDSFRLQRR